MSDLPSDDPRVLARGLMSKMITDVERMLADAPAAQRAALIKQYLPIIAKQIEEVEADDELETLRAEFQAHREEFRAALLSRHPVTPTADLSLPPTDGAYDRLRVALAPPVETSDDPR